MMEKHITFVAALNIAFGFLGLFFAAFLFVAIVGAGIISGEPEARTITSIVGTALAFFLIITSLPEIIGGFGLLKRKAWARILILIVACLDLLWIPIGTIIGIYVLWVLLNEETAQLFVKETKA
jgi:hypothetical protein